MNGRQQKTRRAAGCVGRKRVRSVDALFERTVRGEGDDVFGGNGHGLAGGRVAALAFRAGAAAEFAKAGQINGVACGQGIAP